MKFAVHSVNRSTMMGGVPAWQVTYLVYEDVAPPGSKAVKYSEEPVGTHVHVFPEETLEWRIAEYGLDPTDVDGALDLVLGEPFAPPQEVPVLFTADTIAEARTEHTSRCAQGKLSRKISSRGIQNPLEMIRSQFAANPSSVEQKKEHVRTLRSAERTGRDRG